MRAFKGASCRSVHCLAPLMYAEGACGVSSPPEVEVCSEHENRSVQGSFPARALRPYRVLQLDHGV